MAEEEDGDKAQILADISAMEEALKEITCIYPYTFCFCGVWFVAESKKRIRRLEGEL